MKGEEKFIAEEHPKCDLSQFIMLVLYGVVWLLDSFLIKVTVYGFLAPWYLRIGTGLLVFLCGLYLIYAAHGLVIDVDEPVLVDWGVYSIARHPIYLGIMLVYLGLAVSTLSAVFLLLLAGIFFVYDWFADYEEARIIEKKGQRYIDYQEKVRRWLPLKGET